MIRTTHGSTRTDTLSPYTTLFRSGGAGPGEYDDVDDPAGRTLRRRVDDAGNAVQGQSRPARPGAGLVARAIEAARPPLPRDPRSDRVSAIPPSCRQQNGHPSFMTSTPLTRVQPDKPRSGAANPPTAP